jgi:hypothetical protein
VNIVNLWTLITGIPGIGPYLPTIAALISVGAAIATVLPPPSANAGRVYRGIYTIVNWVALNIGQAKNCAAPAKAAPQAGSPMSTTAAGLVILLTIAAVGVLSACANGQLSPQAQTAITIGCALDSNVPTAIKTADAIATIVDPAVGASITALSTADALVHPAVTAACTAALAGSKPVAIATSP